MAPRNVRVGRKPGESRAALTITHPNAAGIDIGNAFPAGVAVPPDRDDEPVREFPSFTVDLDAIADWLAACRVDTVAMESTGVYWIPLFELLESRGFTVLLVNARHVKNVSGRKSDVLDCQWLQQLMTYSLVSGAFRPAEQVCVLRALWRQRGMLLKTQARQVQHMQKALRPDERATGQCHLRRGGRDGSEDPARHRGRRARRPGARCDEEHTPISTPHRASMTSPRACKATGGPSTCSRSSRRSPRSTSPARGFAECDLAVEQQLARLQVHAGDPAKGKQRGRARNAPKFDLRTQLFKMCGVDLTRIDGIDVTTALAVVSETGADMSRFPTVAHFASWMGLCPGTKITGGKVLSSKTKRCANRAAQALRLAAAALRTSQSALGAFFRRMCSRMGGKRKAVTAAAHKLARLVAPNTRPPKVRNTPTRARTTTKSATANAFCGSYPSAPRNWACNWSLPNKPA